MKENHVDQNYKINMSISLNSLIQKANIYSRNTNYRNADTASIQINNNQNRLDLQSDYDENDSVITWNYKSFDSKKKENHSNSLHVKNYSFPYVDSICDSQNNATHNSELNFYITINENIYPGTRCLEGEIKNNQITDDSQQDNYEDKSISKFK